MKGNSKSRTFSQRETPVNKSRRLFSPFPSPFFLYITSHPKRKGENVQKGGNEGKGARCLYTEQKRFRQCARATSLSHVMNMSSLPCILSQHSVSSMQIASIHHALSSQNVPRICCFFCKTLHNMTILPPIIPITCRFFPNKRS